MSDLLIFKAPQREPVDIPSTPERVLKSKVRTREVYGQAKQSALQIYFGRTENPDPTIAKFGGGRGFDLYYDTRRQITELPGIIGQLVDGAMKRRIVVVPGDPSDSVSAQIADDVGRVWEDIPGKTVAQQASLDTLVTCGFAPIELVWGRDEATGLVAPIGAMRDDGTRGPGLIDRPAQSFIFDVNGNPRFLSVASPFDGEPIEALKFILLQCGTLNTRHGRSNAQEWYSNAWFYQKIREMMFSAVEQYGRPQPNVKVPRTMAAEDVAELDSFYDQKFGPGRWTRTPTDEPEVDIEYPAMPMASAGTAGRSELEVLRFLQGGFYINLLRTQQTQDQSTGSRNLETVRDARTDAVAAIFAAILCEGLQTGWMQPTMRLNYPSTNPRLWSRFVLDTTATEDPDKVHGRVTEGIDRGVRFSKRWYFQRFGAQEAKDDSDVLGHPKKDEPPAPAVAKERE